MQGASPVFYHDFRNAFTRILFYGIEFQLIVFDLLLFTAGLGRRCSPRHRMQTLLATSYHADIARHVISCRQCSPRHMMQTLLATSCDADIARHVM
jgi:hypothetical protein